jgi:hypothetical protein
VTSDVDWNPSTFNIVISDIQSFNEAESDTVHPSSFNNFRKYCYIYATTHTTHAEPEYFDVHEYSDYSDVI